MYYNKINFDYFGLLISDIFTFASGHAIKNMKKHFAVFPFRLLRTFLIVCCALFFHLASGQNIGINTDGTAAESNVMLHVKGGNLITTAGLQNIFQITSLDASTAALKLRLGLYTNGSASSRYAVIDVWDATAGAYTNLVLQPSGGNVGIGFTNPAGHKLAVNGNVGIGAVVSGFNDEGNNIHIWTSDIAGSWCYGVGGANPANIGIEENDAEQSIAFLGPATAVQKLVFGRAGSSGAGQIQYDHNTGYFGISGGNVGIATTTPAAKLEVDGASGSTIKIVDTNQGLNKVLTSDASGQGSWQSLGSIGGSCFNNWQLYLTSGTSGMLGTGSPTTFTVPTGITLIKIIIYGGGAYGINGGVTAIANAGGGGGGYAEGTYVVTAGTVYQVTVGAGGINGVSVATASCFSTGAACTGTILIQAAAGSGSTGGMGSGGYLNTALGSGGSGARGAGINGSNGSGGGGSGGRGSAGDAGGGGGGGVGGGMGGNGGAVGGNALANTGAGGGGGGSNLANAGNGADGKVIVMW